MARYDQLLPWVTLPTWSIAEASHLTLGYDPHKQAQSLGPATPSKVADRYYWLWKEYNKGNLHAPFGTQNEPLFSPGTFLRFLQDRKQKVSDTLRKAYEHRDKMQEQQYEALSRKYRYRLAASLILEQNPNLTLDEIIQKIGLLKENLTEPVLPDEQSHITVRRYLRGLTGSKGGRPHSIRPSYPVDLERVAVQLIAKLNQPQ